MKQLPDYMQEPDRPRSLDELRSRLNRRLSDFREGWRRCDKSLCRRWKQCCGEGPDFTCTDDGRPRRTLSPEERRRPSRISIKEVKRRCAELAAGAEPAQQETPREMRYTARAAARRRRKICAGPAAKTAAASPQVHRDEPQTQVSWRRRSLRRRQQARIDRAWNEYVAEQRAEQDSARERRPRITQL